MGMGENNPYARETEHGIDSISLDADGAADAKRRTAEAERRTTNKVIGAESFYAMYGLATYDDRERVAR